MSDNPFEPETPNPYLDFKVPELLNLHIEIEGHIATFQQSLALVREALQDHMEFSDATLLLDEETGSKAELVSSVQYLDDVLALLQEALSPGEWESLLTTQKPAPPRVIDRRKLKPLIKRGGEIKAIIERAQVTSPARLKITTEDS